VSETINGQGKWLMPTMVDLCARLREPGQQQHGTLKSEGKAARENGILHVFTPPNSKPIVQDNGALIHGLVEKAMLDGGIYLEVIGAQTQGLNGQQPANMAGLKKGGCSAVSNASAPFANDDVVLRTLEYAAGLNLTVVFYAEEPQIAKDGCVHEGFIASRQGLPMIPALAETVAIAKYLLMIEATKVHAHFGLLSCGASVELIRIAKEKGLPVTCDVAMHQLHLTDALIDGFNSLAHVRPPLRSESDKELLRQGVKSGVIDAICTHHEPLSSSAKMAPFAETQPGFTAFDTFLPFGLQLIKEGLFSPLEWVEKVTIAPAKVAKMQERWMNEAGWVLLDPEMEWTLTKESIVSQGKNTPLINQKVKGKVLQSFVPA
jgi:dihydroorotase